jgi:hypothetical protein
MTRIFIIFLFIGLGVFVWFDIHDRNTADVKYQTLQSRFDDTLKDYAAYRLRMDSLLNNATAIAVQAGEAAKQTEAEVNKKSQIVASLLAIIDGAEKETPNSSWIPVSPTYKWGCDSLRKVNLSLNTLVMEYERDNQAHVDAMNYEILIRDSALYKEMTFNDAFRAQLADCIGAVKDQDQKRKPKGQLYAGMAAWGYSGSLLGGGEINLGFKSRNDQFYEIKGAYLGKWWVGVGTKFLIHN